MSSALDVSGADLHELERRLDGEPIAFSLSAGSWSAMSLTGEFRAHGDTVAEVLEQLLEQLEAREASPACGNGSCAYAGLSYAA